MDDLIHSLKSGDAYKNKNRRVLRKPSISNDEEDVVDAYF